MSSDTSEVFQSRFPRSIRGRLLLLLMTLLVPVLFIQTLFYYYRYQSYRRQELQANLEIARSTSRSFESFVQDILHQEISIGTAITSYHSMTMPDVTRLLEKSCTSNAAIRDFSWVDGEGFFVYSSNPALVGANNRDRAYFQNIAKGREWTVGELVLARTTAKPVFGISRGIRDEQGSLLGVVVATVIPEKLDRVLGIDRFAGGGVHLLDARGMLVYHSLQVPENLTWEERDWLRQYPEYESSLKGAEVSTSLVIDSDGGRMLIGMTPVASIGWVAGAGRNETVALAAITSTLLPQAFLFVIVTLSAFSLALVLSRSISRPVGRLREHSVALGRGKETGRVKVSGPTELVDLANAYNEMAEEIRLRQTRMSEMTRDALEKARETEESRRVLHRTTSLLRAVSDTTPDLMYVKDSRSRMLFANGALFRVFGRHPDEVIGRSEEEWYRDPEQARAILDNDRLVMESRCSQVIEETVPSAEGTRLYLSTKSPFLDEGNQVIGVIGLSRDITERKQLEEELRRHREELELLVHERTLELSRAYERIREKAGEIEAILDAVPALVWIAHDPPCVRVNGNRAVHALLRLQEESGGTAPGYSGDVTRLRAFKNGVEISWEEFPVHMALQGAEIRDCELEVACEGGVRRHIFGNASPLVHSEGKVYGAVGAFLDVTERRRAEDALRESRQMLQLVLDTIPVGVFWKGLDLNYLGCNNSYAAAAGLQSASEIIGKRDSQLAWAEQAELFQSYDRAVMEVGEKVAYEGTRALPDGSTIWVHTCKAPMLDAEDQIRGVLGIDEDITERRRAEQELLRVRKLESLGILAEGIAHDFNNLLGIILANISTSQLLLNPDDEACKPLLEAEKAIVHSKNLTSRLMAFARGKTTCRRRESVHEILREAVDFGLAGSNVQCSLSVDRDLWMVDCDAEQISQAFMNLIINAREAMPDGGLLEVQAVNTELNKDAVPLLQAGKYVKILLKDNGIGILKENIPSIFDPYFSTRERGAQKGMGLGLTIAHSIIRKHEGNITVDSTPGIGTVFRIYLPVAAVHQPETAEERQEPPETHQPASVMQEQLKT